MIDAEAIAVRAEILSGFESAGPVGPETAQLLSALARIVSQQGDDLAKLAETADTEPEFGDMGGGFDPRAQEIDNYADTLIRHSDPAFRVIGKHLKFLLSGGNNDGT